MKKEVEATIISAIKENESHQQRIRNTVKRIDSLFPADLESFKHFTEDEIGLVDQFIYRFSKMQDSMGTRLIPSLYYYLEDDPAPQPFLNILSRLEKLGIIESESNWQFFRDLRNNLAHDYPESIAQTVETLNILHTEIEKFLQIFQRLKLAFEKR